jgi:hypothetical protein
LTHWIFPNARKTQSENKRRETDETKTLFTFHHIRQNPPEIRIAQTKKLPYVEDEQGPKEKEIL